MILAVNSAITSQTLFFPDFSNHFTPISSISNICLSDFFLQMLKTQFFTTTYLVKIEPIGGAEHNFFPKPF